MTYQDGIPFFSDFISDHGGLLKERDTTTGSPAGTGSSSTLTTMVVPTTITISTTIVRTTFVTLTTEVSRPTSTSCVDSASSGCGESLPPIVTSTDHRSLPMIVTSSPSGATSSKTAAGAAHNTLTKSSSTADPTGSPISRAQKHAIIGGLSGTIAGLVLIGVLLCIFFRRRQRHVEESASGHERSLRETISRSWSQLTRPKAASRTTPPMSSSNAVSPPLPPLSRQSSTGEFNGSLLRVSMGRWPRPFAHHESFRESVGPTTLQVMNPDYPSRSTTPAPRGSEESGGTYLRRQRSAITAAMFGGGTRSRASSNAPSRQRSQRVPSITVDPALPTEYSARTAPTPSFRSYPSVTSVQTVQHQPPEDPFLTPPEGSIDESQPRPRRPSLATLQSAAGAASRSLSHLGQALNPFRAKANDVENDASPRFSSTTFSSDGDPFRLDRRSMHESNVGVAGRTPTELDAAHIRPWRLYSGT